MPPTGGGKSKIQIDASVGIDQLNKLQATFLRNNRTIKEIINLTGTLNSATGALSGTFSALDQAGNAIAVSFKEMGKGFSATVEGISKSTAAMKLQRAAAAELAKLSLQTAYKPGGKRGSDAEKQALQDSINAAARLVANGQTTEAELAKINAKIAAGFKGTFSLGQQQAVAAINRIRTAYANLGIDANTERRIQAALKRAVTVDTRVKALFPVDANSIEKELEPVRRAIDNVFQSFQGGKVVVKDFNAALKALNSGNFNNAGLTAQQERLRQALFNVQQAARATGKDFRTQQEAMATAAKKVQEQIDKQNQTLQRRSDAKIVNSQLNTQFAPQITVASATQLENYNRRLNSLLNDIQKGKITVRDLTTALNAMNKQASTGINIPLPPNVDALRNKIIGLKNALNETATTGKSAGNSLEQSFGRVNSLFQALVVANVIQRIQSAFESVTKEAVDFELSIAALLTLSQDSGTSFSQWADSIKRVSGELGLPIADVSRAAYDALSNQVIETSQDFDRFGLIVGKLAIITKSSLKDSIDSVSGVMNSFGKNISDAERISAILFKSIDLGKIQMNELASSIGRVGPLAKSLGVSVEELAAFMTVLTRQGQSVEVAMTEVGQVFNKLAKPSTELEAFLKKIGVTSSEEAIAIYSFAGVLRKLQEETGGSAVEISKLFDELRGSKGIIGALANEGKDYIDDLGKIKDAQSGFDIGKQVFAVNDGQKFKQQLEEIKNYFLTTWNTVILKGVLDFSEAFGGVAATVKLGYSALVQFGFPLAAILAGLKATLSVQQLTVFVAGLFQAKTALTAVGAASQVAGAQAAAAFGPVGLLITAITAGLTFYFSRQSAIAAELNDVAQQARDNAAKITAEDIRIYGLSLDKKNELLKESIAEQTQAYGQLISTARSSADEVLNHQKDIAARATASVKNASDIFVHTLNEEISDLNAQQQKLLANQKKAFKEIEGIADKIQQNRFKRETDQVAAPIQQATGRYRFLNEVQQGEAVLALSKKHISELRAEASKAADSRDLDTVKKKYQEIEKILESLATKTIHKVNNNTGELVEVKQFLGIEEEINRLQTEFKRGNEGIIKQEQQKLEILRQQEAQKRLDVEKVKDVFDKLARFSAFDKAGKVKKQYTDDPQKAVSDLEALQQEALNLISTTESFSGKISVLRDFKDTLIELKKAFVDQSGATRNIAESQRTIESFTENLSTLQKTAANLGGQLDSTKKKLVDIKTELQAKTNNAAGDVETIIKNLGTASGLNGPLFGLLGGSSAELVPFKLQLEDLRASISSLRPDTIDSTLSKIEGIKNAAIDLGTKTHTDILGTLVDPKNNQTVSGLLDSIVHQVIATTDLTEKQQKQLKTLQDQETQVGLNGSEIDRLKTAWNDVSTSATSYTDGAKAKLLELDEKLGNSTATVYNLRDAVNSLGNGKGPTAFTQQQIDDFNAGKDPLKRASGGIVPGYASGGFINDFIRGRYAKGTDTVPAMLSPGEFVMNARATSQFLPQLIAMNSRNRTQNFGGGGSVTNVGDISVNVQGSSSSKDTARQIGLELRRELRRGTLKL